MFNPLTRTLKLGLTAITILTAGVGVAFAEVQIIDDFVERCSGTSTETGCTPAVKLCITNPFGTGCAATFGGDDETIVINSNLTFKVKNAHTVAKVRYCSSATNRVKLVCTTAQPGETTAILARPNAANWAKEHPNAPSSARTASRGSQFLKGTTTGIDTTGVPRYTSTSYPNVVTEGSLNFKTDTFNGTPLDGDATDGVAFFLSGQSGSPFFAGIFSGTDLGAPINSPAGTTASWVGQFQAIFFDTNEDFVLEVTFGASNTGSIEAFVKRQSSDPGFSLASHFHIKGNFDGSGLITGTVDSGNFTNNNRRVKRGARYKGVLSGLIGQEGAVGIFYDTAFSYTTVYSGGFVARPAEDVDGASAYLKNLCDGDSSHKFCEVSDERIDTIVTNCNNNPFGTTASEYGSGGCAKTLGAEGIRVAKMQRITFCNNAETPTNEPDCTSTEVVDAVCENDFFGVGCVSSTGYNDRLTERISFCNIHANLRDRKCTPNKVLVEVCKANLFGVGCMNSRLYDPNRIACNTEEGKDATACRTPRAIAAICDADLFGVGCKSGTGYAPRLPKRISFCNIEINLEDQKCTHADAVSAVCDANLFGLGCVSSADPDGSYASERTDRLELCDTDSENALCSGTKRDNICSYAPFSSVCLGHADSADMRTASKFNACRKPGPDNLTCHGIRQGSGKADAATWEDSFMTLSNLKGISSITSVDASDVKYRTNQFVKGLQTNGDYSNLRTRGKTPFTFLTLGDNLVGSSTKTLGGEFEDGVGFFGLKTGYGVFPFHAGILSGTDLGAPITRTSEAKAIWSGVFQALGGRGRETHRNFDLTINFAADNAGGTIGAFVQNTGDKYYHLSGNFDSIGVITGTVDYGSFDSSKNPTGDRIPGRLTGLIGEQGAVGAFIANTDNYGRGFYAGGFVARDVVNYVDWAAEEADLVDVLPTTVANTRNHTFVSGELADSASRTEKLNLKDATYNGYQLGGERTDGVAFFKRPANLFPAAHYAGVLSGTDLGSLIVQPNTRAYWSGSLRVVTVPGIQDAVDFVLEVAFTDNGGSILAEALNAAYSRGNPQTVHLDGTFGFNGVITGTSRVGSSSFGDGKLRGLIGQDGAVGTFVSTRGVEYSGGFVARPHSVNIRDLQNYATLETKPIRALNDTGGFLKASLPNGQLDLPNLRDIPSGFYLNSNTIGRRDGDTNDGYQYFGIINDEGETEFNRYYAGILATTNLGAPLVTPAKDAPTKTAIWHGHTSFGIAVSAQNISTKFHLNFNDGIIGFANEAENGTERLTIIPKSDYSSGVYLTLNGKFGPGDSSLSLGQLGGDMQANTVNGGAPLPVTGLIGQDGVVGVFVYQSTDSGSAGGFTASPQ